MFGTQTEMLRDRSVVDSHLIKLQILAKAQFEFGLTCSKAIILKHGSSCFLKTLNTRLKFEVTLFDRNIKGWTKSKNSTKMQFTEVALSP